MHTEPLSNIAFPKLLVLCPHPDDFDVAGVTLRSLSCKGAEIYVAVAPTSSGILSSFYTEEVSSEVRMATREAEQRESLLFFGLEASQFEFFPYSCDLDGNGELAYSERNRQLVERFVTQQQPDAIFIPHPNDANSAHSAMYTMVKEVLLGSPLRVQVFKQMDPKTKGLRIDFYTPMSEEDRVWKAELLSHHKTQEHRNQAMRGVSLAERILESNVMIAEKHQLNCAAAEAFEIEEFGIPGIPDRQ